MNYLSIPKLQRSHRWSLGMDKLFHHIHYNGCNYLSMLRLKLNHVSKRGHRWPEFLNQGNGIITLIVWNGMWLHIHDLTSMTVFGKMAVSSHGFVNKPKWTMTTMSYQAFLILGIGLHWNLVWLVRCPCFITLNCVRPRALYTTVSYLYTISLLNLFDVSTRYFDNYLIMVAGRSITVI